MSPPRLRTFTHRYELLLGDRIRLGIQGFRDVDGATLQEAADALVAHLLHAAMVLRTGCIGPLSSECGADTAILDFIWQLGEHVQRGGDPREFVFGPNPLAG